MIAATHEVLTACQSLQDTAPRHACGRQQRSAAAFLSLCRAGQPNLLYAAEIYDLHLDSGWLLLDGLQKPAPASWYGEKGLMSLSRAFTCAQLSQHVLTLEG